MNLRHQGEKVVPSALIAIAKKCKKSLSVLFAFKKQLSHHSNHLDLIVVFLIFFIFSFYLFFFIAVISIMLCNSTTRPFFSLSSSFGRLMHKLGVTIHQRSISHLSLGLVHSWFGICGSLKLIKFGSFFFLSHRTSFTLLFKLLGRRRWQQL